MVQIMACHKFGTNLSSELIVAYIAIYIQGLELKNVDAIWQHICFTPEYINIVFWFI